MCVIYFVSAFGSYLLCLFSQFVYFFHLIVLKRCTESLLITKHLRYLCLDSLGGQFSKFGLSSVLSLLCAKFASLRKEDYLYAHRRDCAMEFNVRRLVLCYSSITALLWHLNVEPGHCEKVTAVTLQCLHTNCDADLHWERQGTEIIFAFTT